MMSRINAACNSARCCDAFKTPFFSSEKRFIDQKNINQIAKKWGTTNPWIFNFAPGCTNSQVGHIPHSRSEKFRT